MARFRRLSRLLQCGVFGQEHHIDPTVVGSAFLGVVGVGWGVVGIARDGYTLVGNAELVGE
jgi:hypothetical protein